MCTLITGKQNVPPEAITRNGINYNVVSSCQDIFFQRSSSKNKGIYCPPHVLIKEVVDNFCIPSSLSNKELVFGNRIIGVHAPEEDSNKLKKLANRLNYSSLYGVFASLISNQMLVSRATALLKSDIMELPYPDDSCEIELNFGNKRLLKILVTTLLTFELVAKMPPFFPKPMKLIGTPSAKCTCNILNPVYKAVPPLAADSHGFFYLLPVLLWRCPSN